MPTPAATAHQTGIEVRVDRRTELLAIIFRLAGADEFRADTQSAYARAVDSYFAPFRNHPVVKAAKRLREQRGISNDAVMSLAVHLTDLPELAPRIPFSASQLESRWTSQDASLFAPLVRDFARVSHADRFFSKREPLYAAAVDRMTRLLDTTVDQAWFPRFFGDSSSRTHFIVSIAFLDGGFAYATQFVGRGGAREYYAVMNAYARDSAGIPVFDPSLASIVVHEFSHSFVNPVTDAHLAQMRSQAEMVLAAVAERMRRQGYTEARTAVSESLVRAAVARYRLEHEGPDSARKELDRQKIVAGFTWIDDLYALLGVYEHSRGRYADLNAFFPLIAAYYADLAPRAAAVVRQFDQELDSRRPRVVAVSPPNGSTDVDPALSRLTFRFDRPMRSSYATMLVGPKGRDHFPETSASSWDSTRTTFTMKVTLRPNTRYAFALNRGGTFGFLSDDGVPLAPYLMQFSTSP